ncbi:hypothetical protein EKD04_025265 [Chloroflexales bacterium ZM16-3]|nr:hypothetical protein [Chloroflexales bacterium ZM16-3]
MKLAIVILAGTESHEGLGRIVNGLEAAKEAKEHGVYWTQELRHSGGQGSVQ